MLQYPLRPSRWLAASARLARQWRVVVVASCVGLPLLVVGAGFAYAQYQWRAASAAVAAERFPDAAARLDFCRRVWPDDAGLELLAARVARRRGDLDGSERLLTRCLKLSGGATEPVQLEFLLVRAQGGDDTAADPLFERVEAGHPQAEEILETLALAYIKRLRFTPANACLSKWLEVRPTSRAYHWRGWVYERTANPKPALADYLRALELEPGLTDIRVRAVDLMLADNMVVEAVPHLDELVRQAPDRADVMARLGVLRFLQGDGAAARTLLERAEAGGDKDPGPLVYLARLDVQDGRGADAERRLRRLITVDPSETEARFVLIAALRLQGKDAEAAEVERQHAAARVRNERVSQLLRDEADKPNVGIEVWHEIGAIFLDLGQEARALYWLDKALAKSPGYQPAHRTLADHYDKAGRPQDAAFHRGQLR